MEDEYRPITGFLGYRVSRNGRVQSCRGRGCRNRLSDTWRPLKPIVRGGYLTVNLCRGGAKTIRRIHHLVLEAFVGPRTPGMVCRHLDGDPSNNRVRNLRWGTYSENEADKVRHATRARGSAARSKLREDQVLEIRRRRSDGVPTRLLATAYGVSSQTIKAIVHRRTWGHLLSEASIDAAHAGQQGS
jgi:hypothetical protein